MELKRAKEVLEKENERIVRKTYTCCICKESIFVYAPMSWNVGPICGDCIATWMRDPEGVVGA